MWKKGDFSNFLRLISCCLYFWLRGGLYFAEKRSGSRKESRMFRCSRENSRNAGTKYLVEKTRSVPLNACDCAPCRGAERIAIHRCISAFKRPCRCTWARSALFCCTADFKTLIELWIDALNRFPFSPSFREAVSSPRFCVTRINERDVLSLENSYVPPVLVFVISSVLRLTNASSLWDFLYVSFLVRDVRKFYFWFSAVIREVDWQLWLASYNFVLKETFEVLRIQRLLVDWFLLIYHDVFPSMFSYIYLVQGACVHCCSLNRIWNPSHNLQTWVLSSIRNSWNRWYLADLSRIENALITTLSTYIHIYLDDSILEYSVLIRRKIKDAYRRYRTFSSPSTRSATRSILHAFSNGTNVNYHIFKIYIHFSWEVVDVKLRKRTFRHLFYSRLHIFYVFRNISRYRWVWRFCGLRQKSRKLYLLRYSGNTKFIIRLLRKM